MVWTLLITDTDGWQCHCDIHDKWQWQWHGQLNIKHFGVLSVVIVQFQSRLQYHHIVNKFNSVHFINKLLVSHQYYYLLHDTIPSTSATNADLWLQHDIPDWNTGKPNVHKHKDLVWHLTINMNEWKLKWGETQTKLSKKFYCYCYHLKLCH